MKLDETHKRAFDYIKHEVDEKGRAPSQRALAKYLGLSPSGIFKYLKDLAQAGCIRLEPRSRNGITILPDMQEAMA